MELLNILIVVFGVFALSRVILRAYAGSITRREYIFWSAVWLFIIIVSLFPRISVLFAHLFGIGRGVDLMIYTSIVVLFYLSFRM